MGKHFPRPGFAAGLALGAILAAGATAGAESRFNIISGQRAMVPGTDAVLICVNSAGTELRAGTMVRGTELMIRADGVWQRALRVACYP